MPNDLSLRRLALQIATRFPEDRKDAERVLDYARNQLMDSMSGLTARQKNRDAVASGAIMSAEIV